MKKTFYQGDEEIAEDSDTKLKSSKSPLGQPDDGEVVE